MKNRNMIMLAVLITALVCSQAVFAGGTKEEVLEQGAQEAPVQVPAGPEEDPDTLLQRFSYAFGYLSAMSFIQQGIEIESEFFARAVRDSYAGDEPVMSIEDMNKALEEYQMKLQSDAMEMEDQQAKLNLAQAEEFLAENALRDGVVTTDSGLQYRIIKEGSGPKPAASDVVTVHYTGTFIDEMVFDSSHMRGEPVSFPLGGVIPGWTEGLQYMNVGSTAMLYLHPDLAYGRRGSPPNIGPNELLIFEVELIDIE